jgi:hypothetical protein
VRIILELSIVNIRKKVLHNIVQGKWPIFVLPAGCCFNFDWQYLYVGHTYA